ncbi:hypothetical protein FACS1894208_05770 [Clostridia bacterium]|nr:hypothetical protein FACS1894208_05770 [Clostridia bacterium]
MSQETRRISTLTAGNFKLYESLSEVYDALAEKGYDPIDQIVGYLLSHDPTYITSYKGARTIITRLDRDEMLQMLLKSYLGK